LLLEIKLPVFASFHFYEFQFFPGQPYYNAIVWLDMRTKEICEHFIQQNQGKKNAFKHITGLPINTYFSAFKIKWYAGLEPLRS